MSERIDVTFTSCPVCGDSLEEWRPAQLLLDWRDDAELEAGLQAHAYVAHMDETHRLEPDIGDLVTYTTAWRGVALESDVFIVASIAVGYDFHEYARSLGADAAPLIGNRYGLHDAIQPRSKSRACSVFVGNPSNPTFFRRVQEAPRSEPSLLDLIDWIDEEDDA